MKAQVAQLGQQHDAAIRARAGQAFQPVQNLRFQRRAQRIIRIVKRGGSKAIAADTRFAEPLQLIQIEPGHKDAIAKVVRFRLKTAVA